MAPPFQRITIDGRSLSGEGIIRWAEDLCHRHPGAAWARAVRDTLLELTTGDGALTATTSGTTGPPKTYRVSADDLVASATLTADTFGSRSGDRALLCLPCHFIAGKLMLVRAFVSGLDLCVIDPHGPVLDRLSGNDRFAFCAMVPQQLHRALTDDREQVEHRFATVLLGGGPVSRAMIGSVQELSTRVFQGYGSTETLTHVALRPLNRSAGANGMDEPYTALAGIALGTDDRGCLIVRTPHLQIREHVTNDMVDLLDARHFRWLGRIDHVILSGGRKIHPERIEERTADILGRPHFFEAGPDPTFGQCVVLVLEGRPPNEAEEQALMERLATVLEPFEMPRHMRTCAALERTPSGKLVR
ncbi:MAG: AMP-binding protein [Flavobacteriales bacterium]|nr:AMP-binding protein [Flavobacteriales bacterium]